MEQVRAAAVVAAGDKAEVEDREVVLQRVRAAIAFARAAARRGLTLWVSPAISRFARNAA